MKKIKAFLRSEKAMRLINALFLFSILLPNRGLILVFYLLWAPYLIYCLKQAPSRLEKIIYGLLCAFAVAMIAVNGYLLLLK